MKKQNTNQPANKPAPKEAPAQLYLNFMSAADILATKAETENKVEFDLVARQKNVPTVTLTIYPTDYDHDNAILNLFGFSIRCTIRCGKSGMFLSFPSQRGSDGKYYDHVTAYDKRFHAVIKEVLAAYYDDGESADESVDDGESVDESVDEEMSFK